MVQFPVGTRLVFVDKDFNETYICVELSPGTWHCHLLDSWCRMTTEQIFELALPGSLRQLYEGEALN